MTTANDSNEQRSWFEDSMQSFNHYDPPLVQKSLLSTSNGEGDAAFRQISIWLEDRITRLWDMTAREKLRTDFWSCIEDYLDELECPPQYYTPNWRLDGRLRTRVMYWLISCAISEAHGDSSRDNDTIIATTAKDTLNVDYFPLGFTTDDPQVDQALTYIRMQHLLKLRLEQDGINDCIATLQQTSVAKAKPLKSRKR